MVAPDPAPPDSNSDRRPDRRKRADRLRTHRAEMELAHAEGCTLLEARQRLAQRRDDARWQATQARLSARQRSRALLRNPSHEPATAEPEQPPRWMLFD